MVMQLPKIKYLPQGARVMGARVHLEHLNLMANPENRKRPGTPINKRDTHIG